MNFFSQKRKGRHYVDLNGSPYGFKEQEFPYNHVGSIVASPAFKMGALAAFAFAAVEALTRHQGFGVLIKTSFDHVADVLLANSMAYWYKNHAARKMGPKVAKAAIDQSRYLNYDTNLTTKVQNTLIKSAIFSNCWMMTSLSAMPMLQGDMRATTSRFVVTWAVLSLWDLRAAIKLNKGDWTVTSDPPRGGSRESALNLPFKASAKSLMP